MKKTMGTMIAEYRKDKGLTQRELADQMGVTDKAVSKWERDLSCPDIHSLPNLAQILGVSVDDLVQSRQETPKKNLPQIADTLFRAGAMAMGIAVTVLSILGELELSDGMTMLGIGLACAGITLLKDEKQ